MQPFVKSSTNKERRMDDIKTRIFVQCFLHFAKKKSDKFLNVKGILSFNRISLKKKVGVFVCARKSKCMKNINAFYTEKK